jgi:Bacterial regulatory proteins, tetR family
MPSGPAPQGAYGARRPGGRARPRVRDQHRRARIDLLDPAAELASRPQRVDQLEVVIGQKRRAPRLECLSARCWGWDGWKCTLLGHLLVGISASGSPKPFVRQTSGQPAESAAPAGRRGARGVPREQREQHILDVAGATFARAGYHAASMDEIADGAGVSTPMLYAYFGSKEACISPNRPLRPGAGGSPGKWYLGIVHAGLADSSRSSWPA